MVNEPVGTNEVIGREIGKLVDEKSKAYGDAVGSTGAILKALYPEGIPVEQYTTAALIIRILDKLKRIATDADAFGEDPFADVAGYALRAVEMRRRSKAWGVVFENCEVMSAGGWDADGREVSDDEVIELSEADIIEDLNEPCPECGLSKDPGNVRCWPCNWYEYGWPDASSFDYWSYTLTDREKQVIAAKGLPVRE